jgi:hypothetical protein
MNEYGVVTEARTVRLERVLPGPIERVWAYLTDSKKRGRWFASGPMDLRLGGEVSSGFTTPTSRRRKPRRKNSRSTNSAMSCAAVSPPASPLAC